MEAKEIEKKGGGRQNSAVIGEIDGRQRQHWGENEREGGRLF